METPIHITEQIPTVGSNGATTASLIKWLVSGTYIRLFYYSRWGAIEIIDVRAVHGDHLQFKDSRGQWWGPFPFDEPIIMTPAQTKEEFHAGYRQQNTEPLRASDIRSGKVNG